MRAGNWIGAVVIIPRNGLLRRYEWRSAEFDEENHRLPPPWTSQFAVSVDGTNGVFEIGLRHFLHRRRSRTTLPAAQLSIAVIGKGQ